jgi:hypothetical protein
MAISFIDVALQDRTVFRQVSSVGGAAIGLKGGTIGAEISEDG